MRFASTFNVFMAKKCPHMIASHDCPPSALGLGVYEEENVCPGSPSIHGELAVPIRGLCALPPDTSPFHLCRLTMGGCASPLHLAFSCHYLANRRRLCQTVRWLSSSKGRWPHAGLSIDYPSAFVLACSLWLSTAQQFAEAERDCTKTLALVDSGNKGEFPLRWRHERRCVK